MRDRFLLLFLPPRRDSLLRVEGDREADRDRDERAIASSLQQLIVQCGMCEMLLRFSNLAVVLTWFTTEDERSAYFPLLLCCPAACRCAALAAGCPLMLMAWLWLPAVFCQLFLEREI